MSPQLIELIIFAGIAILIIGKLFSNLGSYDEDDPVRKNYFGENGVKIKEVSPLSQKAKQVIELSKYLSNNDVLDSSNITKIKDGISQIEHKMGVSLDLQNFVKKSKIAFEFILDSLKSDDHNALVGLVDKRFTTRLQNEKYIYANLEYKENIKTIISDAYSFGNNCFIKVRLSNSNTSFNEEWVFTKSTQDNTKIWYLSNIERD
jgi:predicted lipid-binding transport protein (Tim44 family)